MLPDGWKRVKIEDVFEETCEKNHPYAEVLTIIQSVGTVPREQSGREIVYDKNSLANYKFVKKGDFIIHLRSFEGGLEVANSDGIVSPAYIILHPKIEVSTKFLYALFHTNRFINQTMPPAVEGARDGRSVKYDVLKKQKILFPPLSEQEKIAEILATQDRVIELKEKLIAEKQSQKKYLMSVLLGDDFKKPFKLNGVTIDKKKWEKKNLESLADIITGSTPDTAHSEYYNGPFLWCSPADLEKDKYVQSTKTTITELGLSKCRIIPKGAILVTCIGSTIGKMGISSEEMATNQQINSVVVREDSFEFMYYFIKHNFKFYEKYISEQAVPIISKSLFGKFPVFRPSLPEQKAIADVLSAADEEISLLQKSLEQEKLKKKSLMQLLLTGLVRVNE